MLKLGERFSNPTLTAPSPVYTSKLLTRKLSKVNAAQIAQRFPIIRSMLPHDLIVTAGRVVEATVKRRHPRQLVQHHTHFIQSLLVEGKTHTIRRQEHSAIQVPTHFLKDENRRHFQIGMGTATLKLNTELLHSTHLTQQCFMRYCPPCNTYFSCWMVAGFQIDCSNSSSAENFSFVIAFNLSIEMDDNKSDNFNIKIDCYFFSHHKGSFFFSFYEKNKNKMQQPTFTFSLVFSSSFSELSGSIVGK